VARDATAQSREARFEAYVEQLSRALGHADRAQPFHSYCAGLPDDVALKIKPQIALEQIRAAREAGVPQGVVLADAAYGTNDDFRAGLSDMGLRYVVGVQSNVSVWPPGIEPLAPKEWSGRGRAPTRLRRDAQRKPSSVKQVAMSLPAEAWTNMTWRDGSNDALASRFAAARVRPARADFRQAEPNDREWLLIEWPKDEAEPTKYWLSNLPEDTPLEALVDMAMLRWRIERDYEELKGELGLDHFEGRSWRGFHHHAALCVAAYGFLIRERAAFPPSASKSIEKPGVSDRDGPRCATTPPRAPCRELDRHNEAKACGGARQKSTALPLSPLGPNRDAISSPFMLQ
jgi:SRSO17 transposase